MRKKVKDSWAINLARRVGQNVALESDIQLADVLEALRMVKSGHGQ